MLNAFYVKRVVTHQLIPPCVVQLIPHVDEVVVQDVEAPVVYGVPELPRPPRWARLYWLYAAVPLDMGILIDVVKKVGGGDGGRYALHRHFSGLTYRTYAAEISVPEHNAYPAFADAVVEQIGVDEYVDRTLKLMEEAVDRLRLVDVEGDLVKIEEDEKRVGILSAALALAQLMWHQIATLQTPSRAFVFECRLATVG